MVMDQVFSQLGGLAIDQETDLGFDLHSKEIMNEISMDLEDFKFDFDTISDSLGPWIQPNDIKLDLSDSDMKSEITDFEDLNITEAVRYDCMWSSNTTTSALANKPVQQTLCENTLFDEFLKIIDTSQYDLDIDIKSEAEEESSLDNSPSSPPPNCDKSQAEQESQARMFTSLDHCYVSSTRLPPPPPGPADKHTLSSNFLVTPPESSEDEECQTPFRPVINTLPSSHTNINKSRSLLKRSRPGGGGEPKFCFRVKLKSSDHNNTSSRSVLKQKMKLVSSPVKKSSSSTGIMNKNMLQTNIRRRKEESLKLKHEEAREIHNHMERQRRNELKGAFDDLKACIPNIATSEKVSKQMILDTALDNCRLLKSREISLKMRMDKLKKGNADLRKKLKSLQISLGESAN